MSDERLRVTTDEQRERLHMAGRQGGRFSACGEVLGQDETVYWEQFVVDVNPFAEAAGGTDEQVIGSRLRPDRSDDWYRAMGGAHWYFPRRCMLADPTRPIHQPGCRHDSLPADVETSQTATPSEAA